MAEPVYLETDGPVATLTLNQPEKKNAISQRMWQIIPDLLDTIDQSKIRALILTGAGDAFAAGADISEFETVYATPDSAAAYSNDIAATMSAITNFPLPTIAKIDGACVGGGCGLALACDVRFASGRSKFGITPGKLGLAYTLNDTKRLVDAVGVSRAKDILFSGRIFSAENALLYGLVDEVSNKIEETTLLYVNQLAQNSPQSLKITKDFVARIRLGQTKDDNATQKLFLNAFSGENFKEGYTAFLEKRQPDFRN